LVEETVSKVVPATTPLAVTAVPRRETALQVPGS
jgi:hypothetical protein